MHSSGSKTAKLVAAYRARASARPDPVCRDPWAAWLTGDEGLALARRFDEAFPHAELWMALRTAAIDDLVRSRAGARMPQVVILGAGFDTRAARLAQHGIRFFEVDAPATQAEKLEEIDGLESYPARAATYVACDFEREDFVDRLVASGFDPKTPALVVWEGVTYYLPEPTVRATLRRVASALAPESVLVFDHLRKKLVEGRVRDPDDLAAGSIVADLGEPLRTGIDDALAMAFDAGFRRVRTLTFDEICLSYTGTYERERKFRFQYLTIASRAADVAV